jgi:hypothetical protein
MFRRFHASRRQGYGLINGKREPPRAVVILSPQLSSNFEFPDCPGAWPFRDGVFMV